MALVDDDRFADYEDMTHEALVINIKTAERIMDYVVSVMTSEQLKGLAQFALDDILANSPQAMEIFTPEELQGIAKMIGG